jgi:hypothetical protein
VKRFLLVAMLLIPSVAHAQLRKLGGADETDRVRIAEYAESDRQEKWMMLVGAIAAVGVGIYLWQQYQKEQRKK